MSVPAFPNSSFRNFARDGISNVQAIIDNFAAETEANVPPWSNQDPGFYLSPVDAFGRFFDI